jgi:hypothetical protein
MIRSAVAYLGILFAVLAATVFVTLGVWVWSLKADANQQCESFAERANSTLDKAENANKFVRNIIGNAERDLLLTRYKAVEHVPSPTIDPIFRLTAQKASEDLAGSVERAHNAVVLASEAVVVADAALDVVGGEPKLKEMLGVRPEELDATRSALGNVTTELQKARDVLGVTPTVPGSGPTDEQLSAVDNALGRARAFTNEVEQVVSSTRERMNDTKQKVDLWAWRSAVGMSILSGIGFCGQLFTINFFWRLRRGRSTTVCCHAHTQVLAPAQVLKVNRCPGFSDPHTQPGGWPPGPAGPLSLH